MPFLSCIMYRFSTAFFAGAMDMNGLSFGAVTKRRRSRNVRHLFYPQVQLHRSASTRMSNQSGYESITVNQSNGRKATATNQMQLNLDIKERVQILAPFLALLDGLCTSPLGCGSHHVFER